MTAVGLLSTTSLSLALVMAAVAGGARGDDAAVEPQQVVGNGQGTFSFSLEQQFDNAVFMHVDGPAESKPSGGDRDAVMRRLAPVRQRAEAQITAVDRIVGLSDKQKKKLQFAMESDLRRLADTIAEIRGTYAGVVVTMNQRGGGVDPAARESMVKLRQDAVHCQRLIRESCGAASLLSKTIPGVLDDAQSQRYKAVMDGRQACRWKATVVMGLAQMDGSLGLTQRQHDLLTASLLASPPNDEAGGAGGSAAPPANIIVAARLQALLADDATLAAALDPRQQAVLSAAKAVQLEMVAE